MEDDPCWSPRSAAKERRGSAGRRGTRKGNGRGTKDALAKRRRGSVAVKPPKAKQRTIYGSACNICRNDHRGCDGQRPCFRCVKVGCADQCADVPGRRKRRKQPLPPGQQPSKDGSPTTTRSRPRGRRPIQKDLDDEDDSDDLDEEDEDFVEDDDEEEEEEELQLNKEKKKETKNSFNPQQRSSRRQPELKTRPNCSENGIKIPKTESSVDSSVIMGMSGGLPASFSFDDFVAPWPDSEDEWEGGGPVIHQSMQMSTIGAVLPRSKVLWNAASNSSSWEEEEPLLSHQTHHPHYQHYRQQQRPQHNLPQQPQRHLHHQHVHYYQAHSPYEDRFSFFTAQSIIPEQQPQAQHPQHNQPQQQPSVYKYYSPPPTSPKRKRCEDTEEKEKEPEEEEKKKEEEEDEETGKARKEVCALLLNLFDDMKDLRSQSIRIKDTHSNLSQELNQLRQTQETQPQLSQQPQPQQPQHQNRTAVLCGV